jgi:hypothetical protein
MNFNSSNEGSVNSAYELNEEFGEISRPSDSVFEYCEGDDVLYVTKEEIVPENFCYVGEDGPPLDSRASLSAGILAGAWEPPAPDSKFMDGVVSELRPEEVRWFYKSCSDKRWIEFSGYDSLRIESKYRHSYCEWQCYNTTYSNQENTSESYSGNASPIDKSALPVESSNIVGSRYDCNEASAAETDSEQHRIVVRGGMYEVDLNTCKCDSIYWPGRGIYFHACCSLFCILVYLFIYLFVPFSKL